VGFVGSRNDAASWKETRLYREREKLLESGEWCWGDSGYPLHEWMIIPYAMPEKLEEDNGRFNYRLSSVRIESEHAIGYLKGRFQSLRELRLKVNSEDHVQYVNLWIQACIILHSFCMDHELGNLQQDVFYQQGIAMERVQRESQEQSQQPRRQPREANTTQAENARQRARELKKGQEKRIILKEAMYS
jgi:hypothetical protein